MSSSRILLIITAGCEAILGIPLLGGLIILGFSYTPLLLMLILHIVALVMVNQERGPITGSIMGIITSCLAWIPIVGMLLHITTAIILCVTLVQHKEPPRDYPMY